MRLARLHATAASFSRRNRFPGRQRSLKTLACGEGNRTNRTALRHSRRGAFCLFEDEDQIVNLRVVRDLFYRERPVVEQ
jgi:hypothetical protein